MDPTRQHASLPEWLDPFRARAFELRPGASCANITSAESRTGVRFPADFRAVLAATNGGGGWIGNHFLILWSTEEIAAFNAEALVVDDEDRQFLRFGSDGGGETFAFDRVHALAVVMIPSIGLPRENVIRLADSFRGFVERLRTTDSLY